MYGKLKPSSSELASRDGSVYGEVKPSSSEPIKRFIRQKQKVVIAALSANKSVACTPGGRVRWPDK